MSNGTAISASENARRYDIDALRVFAFGLLILFHVGMFYVAEWGWHVKSNYPVEWLQLPMAFTSQWRMPLLFMISGLAVSFIWGKYSARRVCTTPHLAIVGSLPVWYGIYHRAAVLLRSAEQRPH